MAEQVLDLDGDVVCDGRELAMQRIHDSRGVRRAVEEVGVAESDVLRARFDLQPDIVDDHLRLDDPEGSTVNRNYRAMPAQVLAPAARFRVSDEAFVTVQSQPGIARQSRESTPVRRSEGEAVERNLHISGDRIAGRETVRDVAQRRLEFPADDAVESESPPDSHGSTARTDRRRKDARVG